MYMTFWKISGKLSTGTVVDFLKNWTMLIKLPLSTNWLWWQNNGLKR